MIWVYWMNGNGCKVSPVDQMSTGPDCPQLSSRERYFQLPSSVMDKYATGVRKEGELGDGRTGWRWKKVEKRAQERSKS